MDTTAELLQRAAEIIETRGWVQGSFEGPDGACCAIGALQAADRDLGHRSTEDLLRALAKVKSTIRERDGIAPGSSLNVIGWNDHPDRTKDEVLAVFREAAA